MGRPRNNPKDNRRPYQVRLTPKEKRLIDGGARLEGLPYSTWMRRVCLRTAAAAARAAA
jgi:uncharacterized protein (DUF1778 family)